ncbi:acetyl/propionyl/methylcrotonyl-CoA carboxylase subunit alpha [Meridianimarinicoccus sp. MJW13]|uniref:acetyl-CoA carboxylase biotin carboxylase subunit n=1 Tax=Meridianimarinicoccus sp. MJW13 TaxID=2720031 RepID=UPI001866981E|nr:acetyl/propionyl/methylcrotonyl-CoA carboxylase subunit alpha [Fluviibacterium sp. MJW13]
MFTKILIANRGEIAARVITTARRLGVRTVAVYSDADANAAHVELADEAVHIGPAAAADSYLRADRILEAARRTGAEAIHPGYGFLSENPGFVDAVEAAGLTFIGPPADAIRAMGLKDAAKAAMEDAGVPVVPGYHGSEQDPQFLADQADKIGYPVLIKARAGGGGKGMRLVETPAGFAEALAGAQREGQASFGDPGVLIEKYITHPRHVEIQVFADGHGNVVHLFERDCSLQRRHQKVIEEAPAPGMPDDVRAAMGRAAVEAARAIGYEGAGTVEFIADGSKGLRADGFWFMEMNTRLQVEHPVSEAITGLDFVELQLRVAAGEPLPVTQADLKINGWAMEARLYAEDPAKGFLPATGTLDHLRFPDGARFGPGALRIDSGVRQGDEISPWYDPMIAKVIVHAPTRGAAIGQLRAALMDTQVTGTTTNLAFLTALTRNPSFVAGDVETGLIARDQAALVAQPDPAPHVASVAALAALGLLEDRSGPDPWDRLSGWRHWSDAKLYVTLEHGGQEIAAQVRALGGGRFRVNLGDGGQTLQVARRPDGRLAVQTDGHASLLDLVRNGSTLTLFHDGQAYAFGLPDSLADIEDTEAGGDLISAPMPGLVKLVAARPGAAVTQGDPLFVLEAMKMEHTLTAPRDGTVQEVLVAEGDQVTDGAVLLVLEPGDG